MEQLLENGKNESLNALIKTLSALLFSFLLFSIFLVVIGASPIEVFSYMLQGSFGSAFSVQNTIIMSAPLLLVAFCTALPAKLGMVVIGGEGALVAGGLGAAVAGYAMKDTSYGLAILAMLIASFLAGGIWIGIIGWLKYAKGANETIVSLLMNYIAIAFLNHLVEGSLRDPASLNKPSTHHIGVEHMLGKLPGTDIHYGVILGIAGAIIMYVIYHRSIFGFSVRIAGGNPKAARLAGLSLRKIIILTFFLGGGMAGLAGFVEVTAVHGKANASLAAGYGYTGILVAFLARQHPIAIIPVTLLFGALAASNGLIQRRCELPDATLIVLQGIIFVTIIGWDAIVAKVNFKGLKSTSFYTYGSKFLANPLSYYRGSYKS